MSESDHWTAEDDEELEGNKKKPKITHRIMLDDSEKVQKLRDELETARRQSYVIALRDFDKLKDEARSLGLEDSIINSITDPENLQKIVEEKRNPPNFASPENKGSGGSGTAFLPSNYREDTSGLRVVSRPDEKQGSVEQWEHFYEQKLIAKINSLKAQNLSKKEISTQTIQTLNQWRETSYKNPALHRITGPVVQSNENKGVEKLAKKIWDFMMKNVDRIPQGSYEP